jgi:hypothetical protein
MKPKLLVSFSGGETSGFMLNWILNNWSDKYEIKVVFANTGEENDETLEFVQRCSEYFNVHVTWIEAVFHKEYRVGTTHKVVDFETAERSNRLFLEMSEVYGIPNRSFPHCNRELKLYPIKSYMRSIGWKTYDTAIGIRVDEIDRVSSKRKELNLVYPLVTDKRMTRQHINFWWSQQPFRLELKGYQGNCKTCWKKSDRKLWTIAKETPEKFDSFLQVEKEYSLVVPASRDNNGDPVFFFRRNRSAKDVLKESRQPFKEAKDDSTNVNFQSSLLDNIEEDESCDIYSMCGD